MLSVLAHCRVGTTISLGLFCLGLLTYRSQNRQIFGFWSWSFFGVIATAFVFLLIAITSLWIQSRKLDGAVNAVPVRRVFWETGVLLWGGAYLLNALDDSANGAQIIDLNVFGASLPSAALLMWLAMFLGAVSFADVLLRRGRHSKWSGLILMLVAISLTILLVEFGIRVRAIVWPHTQGYPTYTTDLWKRKYVSLNRNGYRDLDHAVHPAIGVRRLLVVGDSFAFGWGIARTEDRFGEQLASRLSDRTKTEWEPINIGRGDTHTLSHIELLQGILTELQSIDVILLLYVFNDMDYLSPITIRDGPSEQSRTLTERFSLNRILFKNLFLYQEVCVRLRLWSINSPRGDTNQKDPYDDEILLERHLQDLSRFIHLARAGDALVAIVPFEPAVIESDVARRRYDRFSKAAIDSGLPVWPILPPVFGGHAYGELVVNTLDHTPTNSRTNFSPSGLLIWLLGD